MKQPASQPAWTGQLKLSGEWLKLPALGDDGAPLEDIVLSSTAEAAPAARLSRSAKLQNPQPMHDSFDLAPVSLPLGRARAATLTGHVDDSGYSLRLNGSVILEQLFALGDAIPQFGDGLKKLLAPEDATASLDSPSSANTAEKSATATRGHGVAELLKPASPESAQPVSIDITATRSWGGAQIWSQAAPVASAQQRNHHGN